MGAPGVPPLLQQQHLHHRERDPDTLLPGRAAQHVVDDRDQALLGDQGRNHAGLVEADPAAEERVVGELGVRGEVPGAVERDEAGEAGGGVVGTERGTQGAVAEEDGEGLEEGGGVVDHGGGRGVLLGGLAEHGVGEAEEFGDVVLEGVVVAEGVGETDEGASGGGGEALGDKLGGLHGVGVGNGEFCGFTAENGTESGNLFSYRLRMNRGEDSQHKVCDSGFMAGGELL